ncbi:MAG TPA: hypothetical protein VGV57_11730 [Thermoleophilaceae bacterium]|nr:hypothetical protein [Thermoleophilaceae bacterium]
MPTRRHWRTRNPAYARLTEAGDERLREAARTHLEDVGRAFFGRFTDEELRMLAELLGRLPQEVGDRRRD